MSNQETILAAVVGAAHGIKGEVKVGVKLQGAEIIQKKGVLYTKEGTPFFVEKCRQTAKGLVIKFKNTSDRNGAEALKGTQLFLDKSDLPPLEENEVYYSDLMGLTVLRPDGQKAGKVSDVFYSGAQDVLVVFTSGGDVLIPYTNDMVGEVSMENGQLHLKEPALDFFNLEKLE